MRNDLSLNVLKPALPKWIAGRIETLLSHYFRPVTDERIEEAAMIDWIKALSGFSQEQIASACDQYLRQEPKRRPVPADIRIFILDARGASQAVGGKGDRQKLTHDEAKLLYERVLPSAHRMLAVPALREHGIKTLDYWGEQVPEQYRSNT